DGKPTEPQCSGAKQVPVVTGSLSGDVEGCGFWQSLFGGGSPASSSSSAMVAAIRAAGEREQSVIAVQPLADPGISAWKQAAQADSDAGHYDAAAAKLDQALKHSPDSPELLQDRAEVAVYQR